MSDMSETWAIQLRHEWDQMAQVRHKRDTRATRTTQMWQECYTNDTRVYTSEKDLQVEQQFQISLQELPFENALFSCQDVFEKCITETEFCNGKIYFKKLYTRL